MQTTENVIVPGAGKLACREVGAEMIDYWFGAGSFARMHPSARSLVCDVCATLAERLTVEQLSSFNNPVLAAYGGACPATAQAIATALVGLLSRARRHVIPGAGHGMLDSHPTRRPISFSPETGWRPKCSVI